MASSNRSRRKRARALLLGFVLCATAFGEWEDAPFMVRRQRHFNRSKAVGIPGRAAELRIEAIEKLNALPKEPTGENWRLLGPRPTITTTGPSAGYPLASGRVTSLAVHPGNSDVVYLGAAEGGVWKTVDGGRNWTPLTDDQISLSIGSLAIDPSNPDTVYAGTGEENFSGDSYYGAGILKSRDAGKTWEVVGRNFVGPSSPSSGGAFIGSLAVHPADSRILLAGIRNKTGEHDGIYRSEDGGVTWKVVHPGAPGTAVLFDPKTPTIAYAGLGNINGAPANGIYKSTDAGLTWARTDRSISDTIGRVSLSLSASNPAVIYAAIQIPQTATAWDSGVVYKSTDGGVTWARAPAQPSYCSKTCFYANTIQVAPNNPDVVLVGGISFWLSQDGGNTWRGVTQGANGNFVHWDMHALAFSGNGAKLYIGTDGGVYRGENVGEAPPDSIGWNNLNDTLAITQFYQGCSAHPENTDFIICGTQDNGTQVYTGGPVWQMVGGGDGGWTAVDRARPSIYYFTVAGDVNISKTYPFGEFRGSLQVNTGLDSLDPDNCSFTPPLTMDPANPLRLYFGCQQVYRSDDGAGRWLAISQDLTAKGNDAFIAAIVVAPGDSDTVYAAVSDGRVYVTSDATVQEPKWELRISGLPRRPITALAVDAAHHETAYATAGGFSGFGDDLGHVFKTTNTGQTWSDISSNLPNVPVNTLVLDPDLPDTIYAGTDIGIFLSINGGKSWTTLGQGLPRVSVADLHIHRRGRLLRAATHGRSMWELSLPRSYKETLPVRVHSAVPEPIPVPEVPSLLSIRGSGFAKTALVRWNGQIRATEVTSDSALTGILVPGDLAIAGRATVSVRHPGVGISNLVNVDVGDPPQITGIANAADGSSSKSFSQGTLVSIYGNNLASGRVAIQAGTEPNTLAGATVIVKSFTTHLAYAVPLLYASPTQLNVLLPFSLPDDDLPNIQVINGTQVSPLVALPVSGYSPGLFSINQRGTGQGWVVCASDGKIAGELSQSPAARPARPGEDILIYGTGLGPVWGDQSTIGEPVVKIGNIEVKAESAVSLKATAGLYEVRVKVPANVPSGANVPLSLTTGGNLSNTVSIAISR